MPLALSSSGTSLIIRKRRATLELAELRFPIELVSCSLQVQ
jgi:hypothetical protein